MPNFALNFPDDKILTILGDDVTLIYSGGGSEIITGEFDWKYLDEELGERIDVTYPVFDCGDIDAAKFKKDSIIQYNSKQYRFFKKIPIDAGKKRIIMKVLK